MDQMNREKVTVVTVVFNGGKVLEDTIRSVINQDYSDLEYIIIDGGSTDNTLDIIKKYNSRISLWVSEPDKGIYDAMNKAISLSTGKWINFMNAGDHFYSSTVVSEIFDKGIDYSLYSAIYGDAEYRLKSFRYIKKGKECNQDRFMPFSHQAAFVKVDIAEKFKFNLKYKIAADTEFFLKLNKLGHTLQYLSIVVCSYDASQGMSTQNEVKHAKEFIDMQIDYGADKDSPYFKSFLRSAYIRQFLRFITPGFIWNKLREDKIKKELQIN